MTTADKIADLERRVDQLEQAGRRYGPIEAKPATEPLPSWTTLPAIPTIPDQSFGYMGKCGKCGITLTSVMSYCCSRTDCPCGLGGTTCMTAAGLSQNAA